MMTSDDFKFGTMLLACSKNWDQDGMGRELFLTRRLRADHYKRSHLQNDLFAQTLRYAQNFILGISIICLW
jgi:hypothetical protein